MGLRLYRKLGQIVDDEDSCEITRIVKSFKPGFPTSSDGEVNNSFELCEIRCLWTIMFAFLFCARKKLRTFGTLVQNGVCKFVENKIGIDRLRFSMKNDTRGGIVYCAI